MKRNEWHPNSLWRDISIEPALIENGQSIFDIIMPWVDEQRQEQAKEVKGKKKDKKDSGT